MRTTSQNPFGAREKDFNDIRFPWIGVSAPLIASIALWAITGSPLSLIFGLISPLTLVAHFVDARRISRRRTDRQRQEREQAQAEDEHERQTKREEEISRMKALYPAAENLAQLVPTSRQRPRGDNEPTNIRIGVLADGHPFVVLASDGLVIEGVSHRARAVRRAVTAQSWWSLGESHADFAEIVTPRRGNGRWLIIVEGELSGLGAASLVTVIDRDSPGVDPVRVVPDEMSAEQLARFRAALARQREGATQLQPACAAQPEGVGLPVSIGETRDGNSVEFDIVTHGPHVIISGTTGSGKSTFIINWLQNLVSRFTPSQLEIAVIDFKGGIDFVGLSAIPHCVGMATDLENGSIERALVALNVEMGRRERLLRDVENAQRDAPPRLLVVLDEFRATAAAHPFAVSVVVDLVARGRALGIHVVLSTQRASTSISDDIIANVPIRIAFRALSAGESRFMAGSDIAFSHLRDVGDAALCGLTNEPILIRAIAPRHMTVDVEKQGRRRQLWMPPLPARLTVADVHERTSRDVIGSSTVIGRAQNAIVLGLADAPQTQDWRPVSIDLFEQGHMLITGSSRSGRTTALALIAQQLQALMFRAADSHVSHMTICWPADAIELWDELDDRAAVDVKGHLKVLIVDGIEHFLASVPIEVRDVLIERLTQTLRLPKSRRCVVTCDSNGAWESRLGNLFAHRLNLVGGSSRPGKALWGGFDMQVALPASTIALSTSSDGPVHSPQALPSTCIVISRQRSDALIETTATLTALGIHVLGAGTPEEWMAKLHVFTELSSEHAIVVTADVGSSDARVLLRAHAPLPPIAARGALVLLPNGSYVRVAL